MRKMADRMNVAVAEPTSAFVPCMSKCWAQSGNHHGLDVCCLLKTSKVCAEVPRMAREKTTHRPVRTAWATWRGAGLILMMKD
jgi:hypothetical protein